MAEELTPFIANTDLRPCGYTLNARPSSTTSATGSPTNTSTAAGSASDGGGGLSGGQIAGIVVGSVIGGLIVSAMDVVICRTCSSWSLLSCSSSLAYYSAAVSSEQEEEGNDRPDPKKHCIRRARRIQAMEVCRVALLRVRWLQR